MNAAQVLDHFDRISDAPDAIPRLRRFILDLAIRGKLVEQDPNDESASELLKRIQAKNCTGVTRRKRDLNEDRPITEDEIPFAVSSNVTFARLAKTAKIEKGSTGIQKAKPGKYPLLTLAEDRGTSAEYQFDAAAAIVPLISSTGHGHASLKRMHYQEGKFALGNILCAVIPFAPDLLSPRFVYEYLWAYKGTLLVEKMIGTANVSLTIGKIGEAPIPIISPRSQERFRKLMGLCDRLEAVQTEREKRRDRLVESSLHRLSNGLDVDEFREHARFHLRHLPRLTTRPEHIQQLRQTLLNLAVRGKLVPQDSNEESIHERLRDALERRGALVRTRKVRHKHFDEYAGLEKPIDLPDHWTVERLGNLVDPKKQFRTACWSLVMTSRTAFPLFGLKTLHSQLIRSARTRQFLQTSRRHMREHVCEVVRFFSVLLEASGSLGPYPKLGLGQTLPVLSHGSSQLRRFLATICLWCCRGRRCNLISTRPREHLHSRH